MDRSELKKLTDEELTCLINEASYERASRREEKRKTAIKEVITAVQKVCNAGYGDECIAADDRPEIKEDCYLDFDDLLYELKERYT